MMSRRAETTDIPKRVYGRRLWPNPFLRLGAGAALLAILLCGSAVRADVAPPPATNCPLGSVGSSGHGGPYCSPQICVDDSTCTGGLKCKPYALCLAEESYQGKGGITYKWSVAKGACYNGETCVDGSSCNQGSYCMSPTANTAVETSSGSTDSGCSCSQTPARSHLLLLLMGILGIALGSLRWRRLRK